MEHERELSYLSARGEIAYNMTNNYMFRYILQENKKVLKGLIAALLHLNPENIRSVEIRNPINLSEDVSGKEFILDIEVHIGFLDFILHPSHPEFYATYKMLNVKNHLVYSDKFQLSVVNLKQIKLATEEDKAYKIDYWAAVFKAKTWEEMRMLVKENEYLEEAAQSLYVANADEIIRQKCIARAEAERRERTLERLVKQKQEQLEKKDKIVEEQSKKLEEQAQKIARMMELLAEKGLDELLENYK